MFLILPRQNRLSRSLDIALVNALVLPLFRLQPLHQVNANNNNNNKLCMARGDRQTTEGVAGDTKGLLLLRTTDCSCFRVSSVSCTMGGESWMSMKEQVQNVS
jgi:hypothetical protein